jgi:phosphoserine phosphatase
MDGTLIRNTDSVRYLCTLNDNLAALEKVERLESERVISWIEADHLKAKLTKGLRTEMVQDRFDDDVELIQNIEQVLAYLRERGIRSVLITAGPIQVAGILGAKFGFDGIYASLYEVKDREFTGRILGHLGEDGKLNCLKEFCARYRIGLDHCVAIGDSESDIAIFKECGMSIAVNYSDSVKGKASEYIMTDDLVDVVELLESWSPG